LYLVEAGVKIVEEDSTSHFIWRGEAKAMGKLRCGASGRRSRGQSLRQLSSPNSSHVRNAWSDDAILIEVSHRSVVNVQYRQRFS
jgi:hypothetical protein